ncbi:VWA domain-containing protein [Salicibibacter halophilus]|uniref:VWA domain-containing protein n=1 Tax=Salicibibacter halophilus TaxID=2502791 RepID=A0A514LIM9_9BACI|nr:VWA domain-containing protein [Salicibibacter halophilus]QDI91375.1 VWA domain-containing protein [Salicibibacter halophilus]
MKVHKSLSLMLLMILYACTGDEPAEEDDQQAEENPEEETVEADESENDDIQLGDLDRFAGDDPEEWMRAEPGTYYEDYDDHEEEILQALQDMVADGAEEEQLFHAMLDLTAEDYRDYQDYFDNMEIEYGYADDQPGEMEIGEGEDGVQVNIQILFDASGSMAEEVDGKEKMDIAKEAVQDFVSEMPETANISLRVYGHEGSNQQEDKEESCVGTEEVYPLSSYEEEAFTDALEQFEPTGYTPLAASIEASQEDLDGEDGEDVENMVYVVSDGEETCGGDPVQAAEDLNESEIEALVNIIGFDVGSDEQEALLNIADAGEGEYFSADSEDQLREVFDAERDFLIEEWLAWESDQRSDNIDEMMGDRDDISEMEGEMREVATEERNHLRTLLTELESETDMGDHAITEMINDRMQTLRSYMSDEARLLRQEASEEGREDRQEIRDEAREERRNLR